MAEYHLQTIWRIKAPLEKVYDAILNSLAWPEWWPSVEKVEQTACGDADGISSIRRYSWRGELPYSLILDVRATGIQKLVAIEGEATGDLEGIGRWHFSRKGLITTVHFDWHVHSTKWWMNLVAPVARALFIRNHSLIMTQGGERLARRLKTSLLSQENIDLMASDDQVKTAPKPLRERGSINVGLLLFVGLTAIHSPQSTNLLTGNAPNHIAHVISHKQCTLLVQHDTDRPTEGFTILTEKSAQHINWRLT